MFGSPTESCCQVQPWQSALCLSPAASSKHQATSSEAIATKCELSLMSHSVGRGLLPHHRTALLSRRQQRCHKEQGTDDAHNAAHEVASLESFVELSAKQRW